jgi:hypothetical protein
LSYDLEPIDTGELISGTEETEAIDEKEGEEGKEPHVTKFE